MSTTVEAPQPEAPENREPKSGGLVASFDSVKAVLNAVRELRAEGLKRIDVHSPHPIHGLDDALGLKGSPLPWGAIAGAAIGLGGGLWMAWWMNAVDYPFLISGKPLFSVIPSLPVAFELAILFAAFAVFGGAIAFGGMPKLANEKFRIPSFARATNDRYLLAIDARDERFETATTQGLLERLGGDSVTQIPIAAASEKKIPKVLWMAAAVLSVVALIPAALIAKARNSTSTKPRISIISDMDHQPKFKAQTTSNLFADGRSMRPQVAGTIARGDLREDDRYYLGTETSGGDWVTEFPLEIDENLIRRGQQRYGIFCATCHGQGGDGDGLVTLRALELEQGTWVKPTSLHAEPIRKQPVGQLFNSISNGVRKMPGYASQIPVKDRWAIVAYLRALQRTRTATSDDVPTDVKPNMRELQ
jgi:mono/diheme cytochrome c family protein